MDQPMLTYPEIPIDEQNWPGMMVDRNLSSLMGNTE
jgi:hypothetical protein